MVYENYLLNSSLTVKEITGLMKVSIKKLSQKGYSDKDNKDLKPVKTTVASSTPLFMIKKLSVKSVTSSIRLSSLTNPPLSVLLIKLSYIKTIAESATSPKVILMEDLSDEVNLLILSDNDNVLLNTELIIMILVIEDIRINALLLHINKKITLLTLVTEQLDSFI